MKENLIINFINCKLLIVLLIVNYHANCSDHFLLEKDISKLLIVKNYQFRI